MILSNKLDITSAIAKFAIVDSGDYDSNSPVDKEEIFDLINRLSAELRSGLLGALAGTAPKITVQSFSEVQSRSTWEAVYSYPLRLELKKLGKYIPINMAAVDAVAKNIFVRRNTMPLNQLMNSVYWIYAPANKSCEMEYTNEEMQISGIILDAFYSICRLWNKLDVISTVSPKDRNDIIDEITFALRHQLIAGFSLEDLRTCCYKLLMVSDWIMNCDTYINRDILPQVLIHVFKDDILPAATIANLFKYSSIDIDTYPNDIKVMLRLFRDVQWKI